MSVGRYMYIEASGGGTAEAWLNSEPLSSTTDQCFRYVSCVEIILGVTADNSCVTLQVLLLEAVLNALSGVPCCRFVVIASKQCCNSKQTLLLHQINIAAKLCVMLKIYLMEMFSKQMLCGIGYGALHSTVDDIVQYGTAIGILCVAVSNISLYCK